ncbi:MAG TPA: secondary thiamine-phosphate synthase enzyme YjbQ [Caldisericia bacterium]|nr:secondary thiamine-phosphate synthase enzyme YjbQ [Caldisericia bacterium]HOL83234.1 secondary thiamine-phosphate synthase enzyme YjbQ [Caldisericia bacterium]HON82823.1 secondary thiamine-phosphate synthase enzyme YjbQ [Caldisericia bacterium]HPC56969.1 secondary thiamine-phosphate synthase enzyme YjbQ [Caldisericia bacterium]HPP43778.1 secondary thiamine-phosphate synthase enzyme YjbQ [Caldisericia bacterium]
MFNIIRIKSKKRVDAIEITDYVRNIIKSLGVKDGACILYTPHTTAGIIINENADPNVIEDILDRLNELVPKNLNYKHLEGNADSHIKSSITSSSVNLIIENGELMLGTWQGVFFLEFDGPRERKIYCKILKDG